MPRVRKDIRDLVKHSRAATFDQKYPFFANLLDGQVHELQAGKDFTVQLETLRGAVKTWAERNKVNLIVRTEGPNLLVQATGVRPKSRTTRRKGGSAR